MAIKSPILLITFNRPEHTRRVLDAVLAVQPYVLYVFQDGAREGNEKDKEKCAEVRRTVAELTKKNNVILHTKYSDRNLGCGPGPFEAMTWFFQNEEKGIILEDDIYPHPLFFTYMDDLLERYRNENAVGMVTAHNLQRYYSRRNSYYFTYEMAGTLGWGTWRRVWEKFDFNIPFDAHLLNESLRGYGIHKLQRKRILKANKIWLSGDRHDGWDYQFDYYLLVNHYLNARANSCLTSHEGDDEDATHCGYSNPGYKMEVNVSLFEPLRHPSKIKIDPSVKLRLLKNEIRIMLRKLHIK